MRQFSFAMVLSLFLGLSGCGYKELPKMKAEADEALKQVVMEYRLRADLVPHMLAAVKGRTDGNWPKIISEMQINHAHAIGVDMPIERLDDVQMNRMASFQAVLSNTLMTMMNALSNDSKVNKGEVLSLKEQLDRAENRLAVAKQKYRDVSPVFNEKLNKVPEKWFNSFLYKFQPLHPLQ